MRITNFRLGLATPLSYDRVPSAFFESFISIDKPPAFFLRSSIGPIEEMRNNIVKQALDLNLTHLMMFDTDQIYRPDTIRRLLSHKLDIVGCMVCRRYPPFDPLMLRGSISRYQRVETWEPGELVEVDATGTGCLLFNMKVFRVMPEPWFKFRKAADGSPVSEDIGFCSDLRAAGFRIFVDTGCPAGHLSQMVVVEDTYRLWKRLEEAKVQYEVYHGINKLSAA